MKKTLMTVMIAGGMAASSAFAIPSAGTITISRMPGYYGDGGGEFTITAAGPSVGAFDPFETFCMERAANQQPPPQTYTLSLTAGANPLTVGVAWLYHQFLGDSLAGYNYTDLTGPGLDPNVNNRANSALSLQMVMWYLEGGQATLSEVNGTVEGAAFLALAQGVPGYTNPDAGDQGVMVLNITGANGVKAQDMLAPVPTPPLPDGGATLLLLGIGLSGVGMVSRRFRRA